MEKSETKQNANSPLNLFFVTAVFLLVITYSFFIVANNMHAGVKLMWPADYVSLYSVTDSFIFAVAAFSFFMVTWMPKNVIAGFWRWGLIFIGILGVVLTAVALWVGYRAAEITDDKIFQAKQQQIELSQSMIKHRMGTAELFRSLAENRVNDKISRDKNIQQAKQIESQIEKDQNLLAEKQAEHRLYEAQKPERKQARKSELLNAIILLFITMLSSVAIGILFKTKIEMRV